MRVNTCRTAFDAGWRPGSPARTGTTRRVESGVRHDARRSHRDRGWGRIFPAPGPGRMPSKIDRLMGSLVAAVQRAKARTGLRPVVGAYRSPPGCRAAGDDIARLVLALPAEAQRCVHDRRSAASPGLAARALDARKLAMRGERPVLPPPTSWPLHSGSGRRCRYSARNVRVRSTPSCRRVSTRERARQTTTPVFTPTSQPGIARCSESGPMLSPRS